MKKIFTLILLLVTFNIYANFPAHNLLLTNTGNRIIYYALSTTENHYQNILCATINNISLKEEVIGSIEPLTTETLMIQPLPDYVNYCNSTWINYTFSFGLTQKAAIYNENWIYITSEFNFSMSASEPYQYVFDCYNNNVCTDKVINQGSSIQYMLDSNSQDFKY